MPKTGGLSIKAMIEQQGYTACQWVDHFARPHEFIIAEPAAFFGHVSAPEFLAGLPDSFYTFTFVRHPATRLLSFYNYVYHLVDEGKSHYHNIGFRKGMSFDEFVFGKPFSNVDNGMTRQLCGKPFLYDVSYAPLTDDDYCRAEDVLLGLDYVGDLDAFSEDVLEIAADLGWALPEGVTHTNSSRRIKGHLTDEDVELVLENNRYDTRLYDAYRRNRR